MLLTISLLFLPFLSPPPQCGLVLGASLLWSGVLETTPRGLDDVARAVHGILQHKQLLPATAMTPPQQQQQGGAGAAEQQQQQQQQQRQGPQNVVLIYNDATLMQEHLQLSSRAQLKSSFTGVLWCIDPFRYLPKHLGAHNTLAKAEEAAAAQQEQQQALQRQRSGTAAASSSAAAAAAAAGGGDGEQQAALSASSAAAAAAAAVSSAGAARDAVVCVSPFRPGLQNLLWRPVEVPPNSKLGSTLNQLLQLLPRTPDLTSAAAGAAAEASPTAARLLRHGGVRLLPCGAVSFKEMRQLLAGLLGRKQLSQQELLQGVQGITHTRLFFMFTWEGPRSSRSRSRSRTPQGPRTAAAAAAGATAQGGVSSGCWGDAGAPPGGPDEPGARGAGLEAGAVDDGQEEVGAPQAPRTQPQRQQGRQQQQQQQQQQQGRQQQQQQQGRQRGLASRFEGVFEGRTTGTAAAAAPATSAGADGVQQKPSKNQRRKPQRQQRQQQQQRHNEEELQRAAAAAAASAAAAGCSTAGPSQQGDGRKGEKKRKRTHGQDEQQQQQQGDVGEAAGQHRPAAGAAGSSSKRQRRSGLQQDPAAAAAGAAAAVDAEGRPDADTGDAGQQQGTAEGEANTAAAAAAAEAAAAAAGGAGSSAAVGCWRVQLVEVLVDCEALEQLWARLQPGNTTHLKTQVGARQGLGLVAVVGVGLGVFGRF